MPTPTKPTKTTTAKTAKAAPRKRAATKKQVIPAPPGPEQLDGRPTEELVNQAASAAGFGTPHRPARGHGYEQRGLAYLPVSQLFEGRFGRMFRLPPFVPGPERIEEIARRMTEGGVDPALDNPKIPSGYTYFGQFIDHDLTFDPVSSLTRQNDPDALTNFRSPRFDLDSVYGRGPTDDAFMYDRDAPDKLLIGEGERAGEPDLPRNGQGTALIGDPRNDENIFVSQFQLTMLTLHNVVVDMVNADQEHKLATGSESVFETAQRIVRWHYQWAVVHDFLRRVVGRKMLESVLDETGSVPKVHLEHYDPKSPAPYMPVEFAVAAYRFGHSMVRGRYDLNSLVKDKAVFLPGSDRDPALKLQQFGGFRQLPPFWTIEWRRFFEVNGAGDGPLQHARLIDTSLSDALTNLPVEIAGTRPSLIDRNLTRGARLALPSGQDVASAMGIQPLSRSELDLPGGGPAPLWYYVLREAAVRAKGQHLGPVGGRIVAEVFLGILQRDPSSYLRKEPTWRPFLPAAGATFGVPDLITASGHGLGIVRPPGGPRPGGPA
jgi:hypothetical protein